MRLTASATVHPVYGRYAQTRRFHVNACPPRSPEAKANVGRPVDVRAYADRIVIRQDGEIVAEHPRSFGRGRIVYDPWHYVPILTKKPGALRNGAPFKGWQLPNALGRLRTRLSARDDGDRQFVKVLAAVLEDGLEAVEAACAEALDCGACSADVVLNILARRCQPAPPATIPTPEGLRLRHQPVADCQRYDRLRGGRPWSVMRCWR